MCGASSTRLEDQRYGYCGRCHTSTGDLRNPLPIETPLILWLGATTATIAEVEPCEDPRPQILAALRSVADTMERELAKDSPTWPPDHP